MKNAKAKQGGFSLIEVLIALVILAVGLLAVAQLQVAAIRGLALSRHMTAATELAEQQLEVLRTLPINFLNPNAAPSVVGGASVYDYSGVSVFLDDTGPNALSSFHLHADNPLDASGVHAAPGEMPYYVRWRVQWGGDTGGPRLTGNPNQLVGIPGPNQMLIDLEVIWWEGSGNQPFPLNSGNWNVSWDDSLWRNIGAHRVELTAVRTLTL